MIEPAADGVVVTIRVIARAGRSGLAGTRDDALLVRLAAAPVEGAANAELLEVVAEAFGVPRRHVQIVAGLRSRRKRVHIQGLQPAAVAAVIAAAAADR